MINSIPYTTSFAIVTVLLTQTAIAEEAPTSTVAIQDNINILQQTNIDSGWQPSTGIVQMKATVDITEDANISADGQAHLSWNNGSDLQLQFVGDPNQGLIAIQGALTATIYGKFNNNSFPWEGELITKEIPLTGQYQFTPFALQQPMTIETTTDGSEVLDYTFSVLGGLLDATLSGVIEPNCTSTFTPTYWEVGDDILSTETGILEYTPNSGAPSFNKDAIYHMDITSSCAIQLIPVFEICAPIVGCKSLEITQIDLQQIDNAISHSFPLSALNFDLPALSTETSVDFGTIEIGATENHEIILDNIGNLELYGSIQLIDDAGNFSVFGDDFLIAPGTDDSLVVSFSSDTAGSYSATLELTSNDPANPVVQIALQAIVNGNPDDNTNTDGSVNNDTSTEKEKGCSAAPIHNGLWLVSLLPLFGLVTRKRA